MKVFVVIDHHRMIDNGYLTTFNNRLDAQDFVLSLAQEYAHRNFCYDINLNDETPAECFAKEIDGAWSFYGKIFSGMGACLLAENIHIVEQEVF